MNIPDACQAYRAALSAKIDGENLQSNGSKSELIGYDPSHELTCTACRAFREDLERIRQVFEKEQMRPLSGALRERLLKIAVATGRPKSKQPESVDEASENFFVCLITRLSAWRLFQFGGIAIIFLGLFTWLLWKSGTGVRNAAIFGNVQLKQAMFSEKTLTIDAGGEAVITTEAGRSLRLWGGPGQVYINIFNDSEVELRQERGNLYGKWISRSPIPFCLHAGVCRVELAGTVWRLEVAPSKESVLEVAEGQVRLVTPIGRHDVTALRRVRFSQAGDLIASEAFNPFLDPMFEMPPTQIIFGDR